MSLSGGRPAHDVFVRSVTLMGTVVTIQIVGDDAAEGDEGERAQDVECAIDWFRKVEDCCSRFDPNSELRRLTAASGRAVPVSDLLFEAVRFAIAVAEDTDGAFDPTVGAGMERRGFSRHYRTGEPAPTGVDSSAPVSYRDVRLDPVAKTIALLRPLVLDLGAVAKGLAIDMARMELGRFRDFAIDAGGDLFLAGRNPAGERWSVGIRHPRDRDLLIETIRVSGAAVCTSGDYERRAGAAGDHHILDPRTGDSARGVASATVIASTAMVADACATAAFVLGPHDGVAFMERQGVEGVLVSPDLERHATRGFGLG